MGGEGYGSALTGTCFLGGGAYAVRNADAFDTAAYGSGKYAAGRGDDFALVSRYGSGVSRPSIIRAWENVVGSSPSRAASRAASTARIFFSPLSTSRFALLYIHNPMAVSAIPIAWTACTACLNHTIARQMTAIRLTSEAIEYVTGEVDERMANARRIWAKWTVPLMTKYMRTVDTDAVELGDEADSPASHRLTKRVASVYTQIGTMRRKAMVEEK